MKFGKIVKTPKNPMVDHAKKLGKALGDGFAQGINQKTNEVN